MNRKHHRLKLGKMENPVRGMLHGSAALLSIVGAVFLWFRAAPDPSRQIVLLIFALSLIALFTTSSLYHSVPWRQVWKQRMQRLDHSMIYMLIAGSYTPVAFIVLDGWIRSSTLIAVWAITVVGIGQKMFLPKIKDWFSVTLQTTQGWIAALVLLPLIERLPAGAIVLMVSGGLLYTVGMVFLVTERPKLWPRVFSHHEVFHICVVAGSALHYAMTFTYVATF